MSRRGWSRWPIRVVSDLRQNLRGDRREDRPRVREPRRAAGQEHCSPGESLCARRRERAPKSEPKPLPLPDKPSIAVLPFTNMSGDPEQEYFADGVVEDIITALSRFKWLFVIARNSSFTYKGRAVDVKQVGRELGVRYVLEGSVRESRKPGADHGPA